jgi:xeroderma pigmentosum group C-complementing protein
MAGGRGRGRAKAAWSARSVPRNRPSQRPARARSNVPDVFQDLIRESRTSSGPSVDERPLKRRKVWTGRSKPKTPTPTPPASPLFASPSGSPEPQNRQTIVDESADSEESEADWEDVNLEAAQDDFLHLGEPSARPADEVLSITVGGNNFQKTSAKARRRPPTASERLARLEIHKMHVCCLLAHCFVRNHWCNDAQVHAILKKSISPKFIPMLHPDPTASQLQQSKRFLNAVLQIISIWDSKFKITAFGLRRPHWAMNVKELSSFSLSEQDADPMDRADFRRAATKLEGSADLGAQLLCALFRAIGVEARLVCSLQPLPFASAGSLSVQNTPNNNKIIMFAMDSSDEEPSNQLDSQRPSGWSVLNESNAKPMPRRIGRIGQPRPTSDSLGDMGRAPPSIFGKQKRVPRPRHPVFWVEVLDHAHLKWIPVDALCTKTIRKAQQLEPALSDPGNNLTYAIAFEEDGSARDVTRRYAKAFNAKTRRLRVESTEGGTAWFQQAIKIFKRRRVLDRDQLEEAELSQKEASEGMPRNVQDFKDHPYYALERHLRRNEVLHPRHEIGRLNVGTSRTTKLEAVFRRKDVHVVRSADKWFRLGREVKHGEQPLKHAAPRTSGRRNRALSEELDGDQPAIGLYAAFQTETYIPPPAVDGRVPKNGYGNIDVYVPSMVPPGAVHILDPDAKHAARIVGVDYADAVTGFEFRGRHGTAVVRGIVVASEFKDAVEAVIEGIRSGREDAVEAKRSFELLQLWRRFLIGLRVIERVRGYQGTDEEGEDRETNFQQEIDEELKQNIDASDEDEVGGGGGFFPDPDAEVARPTARRVGRIIDTSDEDEGAGGAGFIPDPGVEVDQPAASPVGRIGTSHENGGFVSEQDYRTLDFRDLTIPDTAFYTETPQSRLRLTYGDSVRDRDAMDYAQDGGGFVPKYDNDDTGGSDGFFADVSNKASKDPREEPSKDNVQARVIPEESAEPTPPNPEAKGADKQLPAAGTVPDTAMQDASPKHVTKPNSVVQPLDHKPAEQTAQPVDDTDSENEKGSLPSNDPDDEDADPEWLL